MQGLASCRKDPKQPETLEALATQTIKGTGTVNIVITYSGDIKTLSFCSLTSAVVNNLGIATVCVGTYTLLRLVKDLRGKADVLLPTSGAGGSVVVTVSATIE